MTKQEAIEHLTAYRDMWKVNTLTRGCTESVGWVTVEALDMAIEALNNAIFTGNDEDKPINEQVVGKLDLISRQDAIDALDKHIDTFDAIDRNYLCGLRTAMSFLKEMPSAEVRTQMSSADCISRQDAIDALDKRFDVVPMELTDEILQLRRDLRERIPSAQPEVRTQMSSADCISRQDAIYYIKQATIGETDVMKAWVKAQTHLMRLPSAQPEQPIRCKDCKHADQYNHCDRVEFWNTEEDYCSKAERREEYPKMGERLVYEVANQALSEIREIFETQPEQKWIPCSERLPEADIEVFVYLFGDSPYIAWVDINGEWNTNDFTLDKEQGPLAWMPLPPVYKKDGDSE